MASAISLSTDWWSLSCPMDLRVSSLFPNLVLHLLLLLLPCSRPTLWTQVPRTPAACHTSKDWHKTLSTLAFCLPFVTSSPVPFSCRFMFSLVFLLLFMYLYKPFLLPFMSFARFNSRSALAFLTPSMQDQTITLHCSWVTCPCFHLLYISCLSSVRSSWLIHIPIRTDSCHLCLISCLLGWTYLELGGDYCTSTGAFRTLFFPVL